MPLKYACLILDHDDTAVNSSASIHYPAHLKSMQTLRPGQQPVTLEQWFLKNFDPGIMQFLSEELGLSEQELQQEYAIWRSYTTSHTPEFYPGYIAALNKYRQAGGRITVVSHSEVDIIKSHYGDFPLDAIHGWDRDTEKRKPNPWPVQQILKQLQLQPEQALIVDDLKPGVLMSQASGVAIAGAGWGHRIPQIEAYMRQNCCAYLTTVEEFAEFILQE